MSSIKQSYLNKLWDYYHCFMSEQDTTYYEEYFSAENSNFFFQLYDSDGNLILQNYTTPNALDNFDETLSYQQDVQVSDTFPGELFVCSEENWNEDNYNYEYRNENGTLVYRYDEYGGVYDVLNNRWASWSYDGNETQITYWVTETQELHLIGGVSANMQANDRYSWELQLLETTFAQRYWLVALAIISGIVLLLSLVWQLWSAGHRETQEGIVLSAVHKIPLDLLAVLEILAGFGAAFLIEHLYYREITTFTIVITVLLILAMELLVLYLLVTLTARCKAGKWWRSTLIYQLLRFLWRGVKRVLSVIPLVWKTSLVCGILVIVELIALMATSYSPGAQFALWLLEKVILVPLVLIIAVQMRRLQKAGEVLAAGNLNARTNPEGMLPDLRRHAENLNRISDGMNAAVEARMRSERLKTELITNVSHDLKTPLTSIVNYVDLMGQLEGLSPTQAKEYLEVLRRQSGKLKKLTEDLVEASKASSGAMPVSLAPTNLVELLQQAVGEYGEKLEAGNLQLVTTLPEHCTVQADGRLLWRVLDNLLGNCCKYAMPGTRVYLTVTTGSTRAAIFVKNISRDVLNIDPARLMERFVRADASRSSEGSGLGLSIARSLTELQKGTFSIGIDADLFKVELSLPLAQSEPEQPAEPEPPQEA